MADAAPTRASLLLRVRDPADSPAWTQFVQIYAPLIYGFARKKGLQDADAADLTQDILATVAQAIRRLEYDPSRGSFRGWLFTAVRHRLRRYLQQRPHQPRGTGDADTLRLLAEQPASQEESDWDQDYERRLFHWAAAQVRPTVADSTWQAFWLTAVEGKSPREVAQQLRLAVAAVYMAKSRVVHRDIKPAKILLENGVERVKITDFGLARAVDDASLTQSGVIAGTPMYMAPEQAEGNPIDHRADLFSLGSVLYAMCTGRPPFRAANTMAVLLRVVQDTPRSVHEINEEIPQWLSELIGKLHAKDPAERHQSANEVAVLLGRQLAKLQQPAAAVKAAVPPPKAAGPTRIAEKPASVPPAARKKTEPGPTRRKASSATVHSGLLAAGIGAVVLVLLAVVGIVMYRRATADGMVIVEVDQPDVEVRVDGQPIAVAARSGPLRFKVRQGSHEVQVTKEGFVPHTASLTLKAGGTETLQVRLRPLSGAVDAGWVQLFNGKDLTGWTNPRGDGGNWKVVDGALTCSGPGDYLYAQRDDFGDFHLRAQVKMPRATAASTSALVSRS